MNCDNKSNSNTEENEIMSTEGYIGVAKSIFNWRIRHSLEKQFNAYRQFAPISTRINTTFEHRVNPTEKVFNLPDDVIINDYEIIKNELGECLKNLNIPTIDAFSVMTADLKPTIKKIKSLVKKQSESVICYFDDYRLQYKGYLIDKTGIKSNLRNVDNELYEWCKNPNSIFRVCRLSGPISSGKSTYICRTYAKQTSDLYNERLKRGSINISLTGLFEICPFYIDSSELSSIPSKNNCVKLDPVATSDEIFNIIENQIHSDAQNTNSIMQNKKYVLYVDNLDQLYYYCIRDLIDQQLREKVVDPISTEKYYKFLNDLVNNIEIRSQGKMDLVLGIRTETLSNMRTFDGHANRQTKDKVDIEIVLETEELNNYENILQGRLNMLDKWLTKSKKIKSNISHKKLVGKLINSHKIVNKKEVNNVCKLHLYGLRGFLEKIQAIDYTFFDDRLSNIIYSDIAPLFWLKDKNLTYSQKEGAIINLFLVWSQYRRENNSANDWPIELPDPWIARHLPTYWLKFLLFSTIRHSNNIGYNEIYTNVCSHYNENYSIHGYEIGIVKLCLYSLMELSHGRYIKEEQNSSSSAGLLVTPTGEKFYSYFLEKDFFYYASISEDRLMPIPSCFDYMQVFDIEKGINNRAILFSQDGNDQWRESLKEYLLESYFRVYCFLYLLKMAYKYESKTYKDTFNWAKENGVDFDFIETLLPEVLANGKKIMKNRGILEADIQRVHFDANAFCIKRTLILEEWFKTVLLTNHKNARKYLNLNHDLNLKQKSTVSFV